MRQAGSKSSTRRREAARARADERSYWSDHGHRMLVTRLALGISESDAAAGYGVTLLTYLKRESGGAMGARIATKATLAFSKTYNVSIDWMVGGDASALRRRPLKTNGRITILPTTSAIQRAVRSCATQ